MPPPFLICKEVFIKGAHSLALLFVLCTEILPNAIGSNANIEGINIYGEKSSKFHSTQMIFIFFVSDISSAQTFFQLLSAFQKMLWH